MKKALKVLTAVVCLAVMSVALTACSLFGAPRVKGFTYEYDRTECDTSALTAAERWSMENQLALYKLSISKLAFCEDGTVDITSSAGTMRNYEYLQVGTEIVVPDAPNANMEYQGDMVLGFYVAQGGEALKWHIAILPDVNDTEKVDINIYYNKVPQPETPTEQTEANR